MAYTSDSKKQISSLGTKPKMRSVEGGDATYDFLSRYANTSDFSSSRRANKSVATSGKTGTFEKKIINTPTPNNLAKVAFAYLARYAASEAGLRRVLTNRVRKAALRSPEFAAKVDAQHNLNEAIEKIIAKHKASGVINDKNYAEVKARNLRLSGKSQRRISDVLTSKGLDSDDIKNAILSANEGEDGAKVELEAARRLAKRRRLGVYRTRALPPNQDKRDVERRDFASLARAGFSFDVARKVLRYIPTA